jgi:charged multivesicular body protein 2A
MQAMKGATMALGSMNRTMNLPALQRIAMEFERENDVMEQRQEMMDDAIDDAMDVGLEEEGDEVVEQVLEEIGVDLNQAVSGFTASPKNEGQSGTPSNRIVTVWRDTDRITSRQGSRGQSSTSHRKWRRRRRGRPG